MWGAGGGDVNQTGFSKPYAKMPRSSSSLSPIFSKDGTISTSSDVSKSAVSASRRLLELAMAGFAAAMTLFVASQVAQGARDGDSDETSKLL